MRDDRATYDAIAVECDARSLLRFAAGLRDERQREAVERAGMVAGLLPLPGERARWFIHLPTTVNDGALTVAAGPGAVAVRTHALRDTGLRWKRLPAAVDVGALSHGTDEYGCWFAEVSTSAGWCRAVAWRTP